MWKIVACSVIIPNIYGFIGVNIEAGKTPIQMSTQSQLNAAERLSRSVSFYKTAVPVFAKYKLLEESLKWKKEYLGQTLEPNEIEEEYNKLHEWGSDQITEKIKELKGFYVKTGQIISTRVDIFPTQYTSKLAVMQDALDPLPGNVVKDIVKTELLNGGELSDLFLEFDDAPLGSASIAQVHKAKLLDGRVVAVKVQRPGIDGKLLGDITNLKTFAKIVADSLPIDYYKIFCELERTLVYELDFLHEAQATLKVASAVAHSPNNEPHRPPVTVPLPIPGLVSKRVMVLEFVDGIALSKIAAEMSSRGVQKGSPESQVLGRKLLGALTDAYAAMIFGSGIIHGDPHPGNIFVMEGGEVALLDCGQVKELSTQQRIGLAGLVIMVNNWEKQDAVVRALAVNPESKYITAPTAAATQGSAAAVGAASSLAEEKAKLATLTKVLADTVKSFGVSFSEEAGDDCAAAVAILLFGNTGTILPGGYAGEEISLDSPIVQVTEFPSEFILLGRATVMIKGIANRLGLSWGLSDRWSVYAKQAVESTDPSQRLPIWSVATPSVSTRGAAVGAGVRLVAGQDRIRFKDILRSFGSFFQLVKSYLVTKTIRLAKRILPETWQKKLARWVLGIVARFQPA